MPSAKKYRKIAGKSLCEGNAVTSYHLENAGTKKRKKLRPKAELVDVQRILPETADYTRSKIVTFSIQTGSYAVRFMPNPLQITLHPKVKNDAFTSIDDADANKAREYNSATPLADYKGTTPNINRVAYTNCITGGSSCLISEVEIYLDNQLVQASRDGYISITNTLNKLFLPADKRQEIVGHPFILHNELDKEPIVTTTAANGTIKKKYAPASLIALLL